MSPSTRRDLGDPLRPRDPSDPTSRTLSSFALQLRNSLALRRRALQAAGELEARFPQEVANFIDRSQEADLEALLGALEALRTALESPQPPPGPATPPKPRRGR